MPEGSLPPASAARFEASCRIARPVEEVFAFFTDARNLNRVTPSWFRFEILSAGPIEMAAAACIDYRLSWRGLRLPWRSRVTRWRPPGRFDYLQERGPYRYFLHEHHFSERSGVTTMTDRVIYEPPLGRLIATWIVEPELRRIFDHRARRTEELFPDPAKPS